MHRLFRDAAHDGWEYAVSTIVGHIILKYNNTDIYTDGMLQFAAYWGHHEVVRSLLKVPNIDVNSMCVGHTALHYAAKHGHVDTVKILLTARDIDLNLTDCEGFTALHRAITFENENLHHVIEFENESVVDVLLTRESDIVKHSVNRRRHKSAHPSISDDLGFSMILFADLIELLRDETNDEDEWHVSKSSAVIRNM